ncbi:amidohydrolase family protein [Halopenitus salinus]|uniref:Amidohydrolase family protein n=1 Tax=Halopenitus salinus TaxID=1198295 RepID=A0ABD5UYU4_9EURY
MTDAADLVLLDGEIHTLTDPDRTHEALAVRDGEIVRLGASYDVEFLAGIDTTVVDLDGRVLLPGFVDAYADLTSLGRRLLDAERTSASGDSGDEPNARETREILAAAIAHANARGVTGVHDASAAALAPRAFRELGAAGELSLRVRIVYGAERLDAVAEAGLPTNAGSEHVRVGPIAFAPAEETTADVAEAIGGGYQLSVDATDAEAVDAVLDASGAGAGGKTTDGAGGKTIPGEGDPHRGARHRIERAEHVREEQIDRIAAANAVASVRPSAPDPDDGGISYRTFLDAGIPLAFGSGGGPVDPLSDAHRAVDVGDERSGLEVSEALRAATSGPAYAGFDEDDLGTIERGKRADLVALSESPWDKPGSIREIDVDLTVVDGEIVHDAR